MAKKFKPDRSDRGTAWFAKYCNNCSHKGQRCSIERAMVFMEPEEDGYPEELIYDENGEGTCTTFREGKPTTSLGMHIKSGGGFKKKWRL